ncbi:Arc-like DNA binding dprotein [Delftia sp. 60]|uniref:Arc family DNA-binding protein n=1 Tax=Delftia TaxID=80865 RepID=UPI000806C88F|nr:MULTISPECIES: Arc family DNA-binding protein [Delftia]PIF39148.1 Arc-like DNA binding dprotein [Burkholderiales bacterium 23]MBJ2139258.1 Arc family DNA-binding protein [Delftia acidovorans]OBY84350.1 DNA-binding protein [Delftia sp. JD2]PIF65672.1 Arc-like DNA binding dprotein [Delftia sp. 60]TQL83039.1 Arc-like DNA binding dprotein [Delftia sp. HK171]
MKQTDPQYKLRLPQELKDLVEEAAKRTGRSMNAEVVARLQTTFEAPLLGRLSAATDPSLECEEPVSIYDIKMSAEAVERIEKRLERIEQAVLPPAAPGSANEDGAAGAD